VQPSSRVVGNAAQHVGEPSLRVDTVGAGGGDQRIHRGARSPPRSEPAKSQFLRPMAMPRSARSAALLVKQMTASLRKRVKATRF
jgi:hypothetical protein